ncbi:MAG: argininosuccinate lyase [Alkalispirochaeta sp.]
MAKLWDKGYNLDAAVERFTVGRDYILDRELIVADAAASIAHAQMLATVGLLTTAEADEITRVLREIAREGWHGRIGISRSDEDCHTVIESRLIDALGDVGKKVHTGRSRNDQVTAATRLYTREMVLDIGSGAVQLIETLLSKATDEAATVMPGRTHLQIAMLSTWGLWLASWAEQLLDDLELLVPVLRLIDRSPLGSAASYGTPLPLDREFVAEYLGFREVQNNVLSVQHSRGTLDAHLVSALGAIAITLGRIAGDLILFSLPEVGYVSLPDELCSGSSIMPQKKNPDILELLRSRASVVEGWAQQARGVVRSLPSGYNRDLQDTKEPLLRSLDTVSEELVVGHVLIEGIRPNRDVMEAALNAEVFATDYAYRLVEEGMPFRDAYRKAAAEYRNQPLPSPTEALAARRSTGTPGNLNLEAARTRLRRIAGEIDETARRHEGALTRAFPDGTVPSLRPRPV